MSSRVPDASSTNVSELAEALVDDPRHQLGRLEDLGIGPEAHQRAVAAGLAQDA
jgi:hypothetical protein